MGKVRCMKISAQQFEASRDKDEDVMYFVNETGTFGPSSLETGGSLYIGDKQISSNEGFGYGTCNTNAETGGGSTMMVTMSGYKAIPAVVSVMFRYDVPGGASMNINSQGAYPIYKDGTAITRGTIKGETTCIFFFNGSAYNIISYQPYELLSNKVTSISDESTNNQYPSARCMYEILGNVELLLQNIIGGDSSSSGEREEEEQEDVES